MILFLLYAFSVFMAASHYYLEQPQRIEYYNAEIIQIQPKLKAKLYNGKIIKIKSRHLIYYKHKSISVIDIGDRIILSLSASDIYFFDRYFYYLPYLIIFIAIIKFIYF